MDIHIFWFATLGILLTGYAILDGFDLGVGIVHLTAKTDTDRRIYMNSIGPLWDGNEVWLVTFGGALFAAFPDVYATAFSGFYLPFMLLLFGLIFRAVSLEFRSKQESVKWRKFWDVSFFSASVLVTFLFGVAVGNSIMGIPIGADKEFSGTLIDLLQPYSLLIGVLAIATFAMHGSIFLYLKTEGETQTRLQPIMWKTGHSLIKSKMAETNAPLAGELSGHIFFADKYYGFDDGMYCALRLLNQLCDADDMMKLSDLMADMPRPINTPEIRLDVKEDEKFKLVTEVQKHLKSILPNINMLDETDGARVTLDNGWWLVRASNTQACLIARAEADNLEHLETVKANLKKTLSACGFDAKF